MMAKQKWMAEENPSQDKPSQQQKKQHKQLKTSPSTSEHLKKTPLQSKLTTDKQLTNQIQNQQLQTPNQAQQSTHPLSLLF